jgi:aerobic carbon-monoxide dehydrogenase large subunit
MSAVEERTNGNGYVGQAMRRREDPRFITGRGIYVDDIARPGTLHMAVVRSPEAHARVVSIDTSAALERADIVGVFTGEDLDIDGPLPMAWVPPGVEVNTPEHWPLARGKVGYVGQAVAVVVGTDKYSVVDAAEDVIVEYDPLPVVVDMEKALEDGAPLVHEEFGSNRSHEWTLAGGDVEQGFAEADVVIEQRIVNHRTAGAAIEPRGAIAEWHADRATLYSATQIPHILRLQLAVMLGIAEDRIRVIAPDVGGAFGTKLNVYGEEALVMWLARKLNRPVRWTETRSENMATTIHGRDQIDYVKLGAKRDGTLTAIHTRVLQDCGAYFQLLTPYIPCFTAFVMSGPYRIPNVKTDITGVFTNKFATDATRGAGRPEATHLIEVMMDQLAVELDMDRLELRRKNFIPKEDFPAEVPIGVIYDSGDYHGTLDKLLGHVDLDEFRREQAELREKGVHRGIGFSTYVEICGLAPSRAVGPSALGLQAAFYESAVVRVHPSGAVTVFSGASPHGQGLDTSLAQITADRIGAAPEQVEVVHGDTSSGPWGWGTYGSRSLSVGGEAVARAALKVQDKAKRICASMWEAAPEDIELSGDKFQVRGSPDKSMTLAEVAGAAYIPPEELSTDIEPGLEETSFYDPENFVWPFGAHACIVDVDVETGKVNVVRYVAVDDCGKAINPMLIDGQVHGGITHGLAQALFEQVVYDDEGQLVTGSFVDYALPTASDVPSYETDRQETPSPVNSLGVKGVGEAGTIASSPTVVNAVIDALRPFGVDYIDMPLTPMRVWQAIHEGGPARTEQGKDLGEHGQGAAGSGPAAPSEGGGA